MTFNEITNELMKHPNCYLICKGFHVADLHDFVALQKGIVHYVQSKGFEVKRAQTALDAKKHLKLCLEALQDSTNIKPLNYQHSKKYTIYPLV